MGAKGTVGSGLSELERHFVERGLLAHPVPVPPEGLLEFHETPGRLVPVKGPGYQVTREDGDVRLRPGQEVAYGFEGIVYVRCKDQAHKQILSGHFSKIPGRKTRFCQAWGYIKGLKKADRNVKFKFSCWVSIWDALGFLDDEPVKGIFLKRRHFGPGIPPQAGKGRDRGAANQIALSDGG
jgi:hypothetical protein